MGTGKTTIGKLVATKLDREFIDTDEYIDKHFGPAANILNQPNGDNEFRILEEKVAHELSKKNNLVISTGGRFMLNQTSINVMQETGFILCLEAELHDIVNRLQLPLIETYRPRFANAKNKLNLMEQLKEQSEPYLNQFEKIQTTGCSLDEIVANVLLLFSKHCGR